VKNGPLGVAVLGSTGSIGRQALEVLARHPDRFRVVALAARRPSQTLLAQAAATRPAVIGLTEASGQPRPDVAEGTAVVAEPEALAEIAARDDVDIVLVGTSGVVSLVPVLAALRAGKVVATANKETLVAGGHLVMAEARRLADAAGGEAPTGPWASPLAWLRPIDSEHSAIWQCLVGEPRSAVRRLVLTASGGPFVDGPDDLSNVTPALALRHPTWTMGAKVTIDSATLANKGLEVIEARWLYDVPDDAVDVVIHRQSVIHSAVVFADGSIKAQLGTPDMRIPIQYALTHPDRATADEPAVDLVGVGRLDVERPDERRFPALGIARAAGRTGSRASAALIAADDVAVERFLAGSLDFPGIPRLLEAAVTRYGEGPDQAPGVDDIVALTAAVRAAYATGPVA
jgi:1-deoxy-D-xylulose-5-phosphate reductoisomerase